MRHGSLPQAALLAASLCAGCTQLEQSLSSPLDPSAVPSVQIPSLTGTWTSSTVTAVGSSCTNFQWRITAQSVNTLTGEFSAECVGGIAASGTITGSLNGSLNGSEVPYLVNGTATVAGGLPCPVTLTGVARLEGEAIRIPYEGTTCLGPARGEEVLRRTVLQSPVPAPVPTPSAPTPAPPPEPSAPAPPSNMHHVGAGALTADRAYQVVMATSREHSHLIAAKHSEAESLAGSHEMLRRMIWHLQLAGYQAGRQRNPSGALSNDKLTVFADGSWRGFDVFFDLGHAGSPTQVIWWDLGYADHVPDPGIPD